MALFGPDLHWLGVIVMIGLLIGLPHLSKVLVEQPILKLKDRFPNQRPKPAPDDPCHINVCPQSRSDPLMMTAARGPGTLPVSVSDTMARSLRQHDITTERCSTR